MVLLRSVLPVRPGRAGRARGHHGRPLQLPEASREDAAGTGERLQLTAEPQQVFFVSLCRAIYCEMSSPWFCTLSYLDEGLIGIKPPGQQRVTS